ncbi:T9SS type A sorting domain-containing protein [Filimonas effusa]|uniref:T9SS type A sorting domain-containing protein n=1 Tax=Filimonas effusa TaxID=2508721 RepID=A0A4Q1D511_9BACT|nr:T9SS type A sorting domain-containing protein [Filimonas effusa]RXK83592.1 T9SS type A sorting domain-containing protein [Filimonas effusa]
MNPRLLAIILFPLAQFSAQYLQAQGLITENGSHLVVNGAASIVINNSGFNNSGNFVPGTGTVAFTGVAASEVSGAHPSSFYNFLIRKPGSSLTLSHNIGVSNILTMGDGLINLNGFDLDLGSTGAISGERPLSRITGTVGGSLIRSAILNAPNQVNPGNIGVEITSSGNAGLTVIRRSHRSVQLDGGFGMQRFYNFSVANAGNERYTLRFHYFEEELAGISESELAIYSVDAANPGGDLEQSSVTNAAANYVEVSNVSLTGSFVPASNISDPARSSYFAVAAVSNRALLSWGTLYEINTDHFELERSLDGSSFSRFAIVPAAGTVIISNDYTYTDPELLQGPYFGTSPRYYRYKIVFKDGRSSYSNIISVAPEGYPNHILSVYPSPTTGPLTVRFSSFRNQKVTLQVVDNLGRVVEQKETNAVIGPNMISCDISHVVKGIYYVRLLNIEKRAYKILKQ